MMKMEEGEIMERAKELQTADPKLVGIEEIDYDAFVRGVPEVVKEKMEEAIKIIEDSVNETRENLKDAESAFDDGLLGTEFWDPVGEIADYWPFILSNGKTHAILALVQMNATMVRGARHYVRRHGKDSDAKFYKKNDLFFWDYTGKRDPVKLIEEILGTQHQQMSQGQSPPMSPAPPGMEVG
jgi:hypothetical protein